MAPAATSGASRWDSSTPSSNPGNPIARTARLQPGRPWCHRLCGSCIGPNRVLNERSRKQTKRNEETMKLNKMMVAALVVALVAGSAMAGVKQAERSSNSLKATQTEVQDAYNQITATIGSLGTLMSAQVGDLRPDAQGLQLPDQAARSRMPHTVRRPGAQHASREQGILRRVGAGNRRDFGSRHQGAKPAAPSGELCQLPEGRTGAGPDARLPMSR